MIVRPSAPESGPLSERADRRFDKGGAVDLPAVAGCDMDLAMQPGAARHQAPKDGHKLT